MYRINNQSRTIAIDTIQFRFLQLRANNTKSDKEFIHNNPSN